MNNKSGAGFQKDHREKIELVRACDGERWRTHTEENVEDGYTREKEERTTENKMERRVSTRFEKYWTESGRGDGQGDVEKKDHQLYRRPYMMGKARGKQFKSTWSECRRWSNVGPTLESFCKSAALRKRFANRSMTIQNCLNVHVLINFTNF